MVRKRGFAQEERVLGEGGRGESGRGRGKRRECKGKRGGEGREDLLQTQ
jgi:hypothetical protein